jgi:signal transduction histidine kinase
LVRDVRRLSSLVSAMLDLARLKDAQVEKKQINLSSLTREVLSDYAPLALDGGIELSMENTGAESSTVEGVEAALRSALSNLVGNALMHAKGATAIVAKVSHDAISVSDNGGGLPSRQGDSIIEPFQKGDPLSAGVGLGLSIVREIMIAHGGSLALTSTPGQGTTITLNFKSQSGRQS